MEHVPTSLFSWFGFFFCCPETQSNNIEINNGYFQHYTKKTHVELVPTKKFRVVDIPSKRFDSLNCDMLCYFVFAVWWILLRNRSHYYLYTIHTTAQRLTHTSSAMTGNNTRLLYRTHSLIQLQLKIPKRVRNVCISLLNRNFASDIL